MEQADGLGECFLSENLWKRAVDSLPRRAILCFAGCGAIVLLGQLMRAPVSGVTFVPYWLRHILFYIWLAVSCALAAMFLWFLGIEIALQKRQKVAERLRKRVDEHIHLAVQMAGELAANSGTPGFTQAVDRYFSFLFYCIPQLLTPASEIRRLAFLVSDGASGDPPALLRVERACDAFPSGYQAALRLKIAGSIAGKVYRTGRSYRGGPGDPDWQDSPDDPAKNYQTVMCAPVALGEKVIGVLSIDHSECGAFSDEDQDRLELFARLFALVWALTHRREQDGTGRAE